MSILCFACLLIWSTPDTILVQGLQSLIQGFFPEFIFIPHGKTRFARRSIPLTEQAREVLFPRKREARNGWLFPHRTDPDRHFTICRSFLDVTRSLGLDFRLYDLRHTFGSRAVMAGVDLPTLKELMGHSTITMTMRYVHPTPEHKKEALRKVERFQGTPKITPTPEIVETRIVVDFKARRSGRVVEGGGLENRCTRKGTRGSNPFSSANLQAFGQST